MQKACLKFLFYYTIGVIITGCYNKDKSDNPDIWLGDYEYDEKPVKAIAGYSMTMNWQLSISRKGEKYVGKLNITGQQTNMELLTAITGNSSRIFVLYNSLISGMPDNLESGDTLFILKRTDNSIKTEWSKLESRLRDDSVRECKCFTRINKN